ncbi:hypothetical protein JI752_008115 [Lysobacter sp. MMG2]|uniref:DUF6587 family protein n=1 Tax=Lysobacter sp. MMG2 TaxID=2801338 RepID=UPI001C21003A|nr:DUF6587 family protein [Lysobacter sp. MMG2]MBU8976110.1 hypothetical protein [Lysobacter sp. MMG2]
MDAGLLAQYAIIAVAVLLSAWFVAKRQFPNAVRRLRIAIAIPLVREGRAGWAQKVGRWIAPPAALNDGSCGGCNSCGPTIPKRH